MGEHTDALPGQVKHSEFAKPLDGDPYDTTKLDPYDTPKPEPELRIEFLELDIEALLQYYVSGYQTTEKETLSLRGYYLNLQTGKIALKILLTPQK